MFQKLLSPRRETIKVIWKENNQVMSTGIQSAFRQELSIQEGARDNRQSKKATKAMNKTTNRQRLVLQRKYTASVRISKQQARKAILAAACWIFKMLYLSAEKRMWTDLRCLNFSCVREQKRFCCSSELRCGRHWQDIGATCGKVTHRHWPKGWRAWYCCLCLLLWVAST